MPTGADLIRPFDTVGCLLADRSARSRLTVLGVTGGALVALAGALALSGASVAVLPLAVAGGTLVILALMLHGLRLRHGWRSGLRAARIQQVVGPAPVPHLLVDPLTGRIRWQNTAASTLGCATGDPVHRTVSRWSATPTTLSTTLLDSALARGATRRVLPASGSVVDMELTALGDDAVLWRIDTRMTRPTEAARTDTLPAPRDTSSDNAHADPRHPTGPAPVPVPGDSPGSQPHGDGPASAIEGLPVALARLSSVGQMTDVNAEARRLLGLDATARPMLADALEGLGRPVADWFADARAGRTLDRPEILRPVAATGERFVQVTLRRATDRGIDELMAVIIDATEFKALEARFTQSQKMQVIGQLAGGIAHDFNNLLTAITGYCDLLLMRHERNDRDYPDLEQINQNANRAASLVRQLLAFSRKQALQFEVLDLGAVLADLTHLLNRLVGERVTLTLSHGEGLGPIRADRRQLEQVLMNLVVNARDAMPSGGAIQVTTSQVHLQTGLRRDRAIVPPGTYAQVTVTDEGEGIAPDVMPRIFEPFFTTKRVHQGTGLGLSTAYGIVKQSGGFIFADSTPGKGTCFTLYFAIHTGAADATAPADAAQPSWTPPPTCKTPETPPAEDAPPDAGVILLVEDEAPVRALGARALQLRGHTVLEAASGEEALHMLQDPGIRVDLFVTDVIMPGLDGPGWVQQALRDRPGTAVVFMSGHAEDSALDAGHRTPGSVFLGKPFALAEFARVVEAQLARA